MRGISGLWREDAEVLAVSRIVTLLFPCHGPTPAVYCPPQLHTLSDALWGPDRSPLQLNFRATQPLNGRIIEASFPAGVDRSPRTVEPGAALSSVPQPQVPQPLICPHLCLCLSLVVTAFPH